MGQENLVSWKSSFIDLELVESLPAGESLFERARTSVLCCVASFVATFYLCSFVLLEHNYFCVEFFASFMPGLCHRRVA